MDSRGPRSRREGPTVKEARSALHAEFGTVGATDLLAATLRSFRPHRWKGRTPGTLLVQFDLTSLLDAMKELGITQLRITDDRVEINGSIPHLHQAALTRAAMEHRKHR